MFKNAAKFIVSKKHPETADPEPPAFSDRLDRIVARHDPKRPLTPAATDHHDLLELRKVEDD